MGLTSWIESANQPGADFPLANLPYGVFRHPHAVRIGVAIGDQILDLRTCATEGLLKPLASAIVDACTANVLNPLMALGWEAWSALRRHLTSLLDAEHASGDTKRRVVGALVPMKDAEMQMPAQIGDYTDFYACLHHATRVGKMFRPENPLLPNYKYVPIGYHGRASSIVPSGQAVRRPCGQSRDAGATQPSFGPTRRFDYEAEVGIFIGKGNTLGEAIPIGEAERHVFGLCVVNDWSARDIQAWEYQPLGPFLAKSFTTTISPWIVPLEALAPYRVNMLPRDPGDPSPLPYLTGPGDGREGIDVVLEVFLQSGGMRQEGHPPVLLSRGKLRDLYWSIAQLVTHHASNGCNLRPGDLLATGTISGAEAGSEGCLLEMQGRAEPLNLPGGERRGFLEDGDRVVMRAFAEREGLPRIGFGCCEGTVLPATSVRGS